MCGCGCNTCGDAKKPALRKVDLESIKNEFKKIGIVVENEEHIELLKKLADAGGDKAGYMTDENGNAIHFDAYDIICKALIKNLKN